MENVLYERAAEREWPYRSALGGHRVLIEVTRPSACAEITLAWRRRDLYPEKLGMRLVYLDDDTEIFDICLPECSREGLRARFRAEKPGLYGLYYLPYRLNTGSFLFEKTDHMLAGEMRPEAGWLAAAKDAIPEPARVIALEARNEFERFGKNETPASPAETGLFREKYPGMPFAVFGETRDNPMWMTDEIPYHWTYTPAGQPLNITGARGESLAFQVCVYALTDLHGLTLTGVKSVITEGRDWLGRGYTHPAFLPAGRVQTLWAAETLPDIPGEYSLNAEVVCAEGKITLPVNVTVTNERAERSGEDSPERFTRLSWFDSDRGIDNETFADYPPVGGTDSTFTCEGRQVEFDPLGLPCEITSFFTPDLSRTDGKPLRILDKGLRFSFELNGKRPEIAPAGTRCVSLGSGAREYIGGGENEAFTLTSVTRAEADGHLDTLLTLTAKRDIKPENICLTYDMTPECALYSAGFGREGGRAARHFYYTWDERFANNMLWLGGVRGGLQIKYKHTPEVWEVYSYRSEGLPDSWHCGGRGYVEITGGNVRACCGDREIRAGESFSWRFALLITPLMRRNMAKHWAQRYHHVATWDEPMPDLEQARAAGATVVNLHQGGELNAYINYPFLKMEQLKRQIEKAHALGMKYKLYYTVREISNRVCELPVLMAMGGEVLRKGEGFRLADHFDDHGTGTGVCGPWLKEHMREGCVPAWQQRLADGDLDSAVATTGLSRWHNYYIEGLRYLMAQGGMDGIYLDGVGYDREIMKRVRKTMDLARPGGYIDFHSGNNFHPIYGLANPIMQYLELMPCVDRLWIGEGYDFDTTSPDYWLVEMTGIPFGLTGEMLGPGGGNRWKGMVFGMSCRFGWLQGGNPTPLWRAWDKMGLTGSNMRGWWQEDCPVTADSENIKATLFENGSKRFAAVASWESKTRPVRLFGLERALLRAPEIEDFQPAAEFKGSEPIEIRAGEGWLFEIIE